MTIAPTSSSRQFREKIITVFRWNFKIVAFKDAVYAATEMYQLLWFIKFADMWTVPPSPARYMAYVSPQF
ncbi:MAG TPA: hypothetical protein DCL74_03095 [Succinivibrionaceae bacterium]|nr:hypothetical protein [Succinivibrionaceae bacterium]